MSMEQSISINEQHQSALNDLEELIRARYPDAQFEVVQGIDDPEAIHLNTTVDVEDVDEVLDVVIDRLFEIQVEQGLPIHVIPLQPVERVLEEMAAEAAYARPRRRYA